MENEFQVTINAICMIETKDITKMVKQIIKREKGAVDVEIIHPAREWMRGLGLVLVGLVLGSWFCINLYSNQYKKITEELITTESVVPYNAVVVEEALKLFKLREEKFSAIINDVKTNDVAPPLATSSPTGEITPVLLDDLNTETVSTASDNEVELPVVPAL